jgi:tetratricopeptide (TPR) repeat protein
MGRDKEAEAVMERAFRLPGTPVLVIHIYAFRLLAAGKKEKALEVFKFNQQQHPDEKFWTYLGLARAYTALGDKQNAIANWELALPNAPDSQKPNLPTFEKALKALKEAR